jgi:hypothetical protein
MRTSLDLTDELMREAKIAAVNRGITFRQLVTEALEHELQGQVSSTPLPRRVAFPVIPASGVGTLRITPEMIREAELEDDLQRGGFR